MKLLNQVNPVSTNSLSRADDSHKSTDIKMENITSVEVHNIFESQKNNRAPVIDEIPPKLLEHCQDIITEELTNLFNNIQNSGLDKGHYCQSAQEKESE